MSDTHTRLPCLVCGRALTNLVDPALGDQPDDALVFHTHGHYGSGVFDEGDGRTLRIIVCDPCIETAMARGRVYLAAANRPEPATDDPATEFADAEVISSWDDPHPLRGEHTNGHP